MPGIKRGTAYLLSMGCSKNTVDSERFAGTLRDAGYEIVPGADGAEICLVNTCGFLREAVEENIAAILDIVDLKSSGAVGRIAVVGCLVNRYGELGSEIPEVDFWGRCEDYVSLLRSMSREDAAGEVSLNREPLPGALSHVRYLKISEGCDNRCSYCAIPSIRGGLRSEPISSVVGEANFLVESGAKELCLVGQDLTAYGRDHGKDNALLELLDALESSLPKSVWIRLLYLQPDRVDTRLLERMASGGLVLPYLDMPVQHSSPRVLAAMNRESDREKLMSAFKAARKITPDFALRTTCMVGFPGEKKEDFDDLLRFLEEASLDRVGAFSFSPEEETKAASMPDQTPRRTKLSRLGRLMSLQESISLARGNLFVGREMDVLIDAILEPGVAEGRSFREAPEVDGVIEIRNTRPDTKPGDSVRVIVTDAFEHDLIARETRV
ncbi:MAG: 30S ribosomal protein S12 methylthiotransferase RimO [Synergistaceae bacterium]|jgi:ribosomal protein S12 methylthiotransferase|nr:30S ribosomal protein S12 methylthiotransferase RimO [Synergistaceae bacterium]